MIRLLLLGILALSPTLHSQTEGEKAGKSGHGPPATISSSDLKGFSELPEKRRKLLETALSVRNENPWLPYLFGGATPAAGGFDCSGAMYFVLRKSGLEPPRTSSDQYLWVREKSDFHEVPASATTLKHPSLKHLQPGDLLFWSGTYSPTDGRKTKVTHVAIFLGYEKKDKHPVMINATDGRSYRGKQANGFGVYDFRIPKAGSRSRFVGYGSPPGLGEPS